MTDPIYLTGLESGNVGVLLGASSGGLCAIDIDSEEFVEPFLHLNPNLTTSLRSRGKRGCQIWVKISGNYPKACKLLTCDGEPWGEWRADGNQSVIHGIHPEGMSYERVVDSPPAFLRFEEIQWPGSLNLPWIVDPYDRLVESEGEPYIVGERGGLIINQMFFAEKYRLEHLVTYSPDLGEFFEYGPLDGLWKRVAPDQIKKNISHDLQTTAKITGQKSFFFKRGEATLNNIISMIRVHADSIDFSERPPAIHGKNGMICAEGKEVVLRGFHPRFYSRNCSPFEFDLDATCPRFLNELLGTALNPEDIVLLQKWAGSVLLGRNTPQRLLLLTGAAGGGKSTLMAIIERIIGKENVAQMRTEHLLSRFELYGYAGKMLLTGKDVSADFLMHKGAHMLKSLVGGDLLEAEKKGHNERVQMPGDFNVGITCNSDLNIRLEGDEDAWERRLLIVNYERSALGTRIPNFADLLLEKEGKGILRWLVDGAMLLLADLDAIGDYVLTKKQKARIENAVSRSKSVELFVQQEVERAEERSIGSTELFSAYQDFCGSREWEPLPNTQAHKELLKQMAKIHHSHLRHDIRRGIGTVRGYRDVKFRREEDQQ